MRRRKFFSLTPPSLHGCCSGSFEAPGHSCTQLPGRLAHPGPLQGVSEPSQGCRPPSHSCSWPQNEHQEECSLPFSTNCVFGSSLGFRSNAGPSGSCPDFQPQHMFGPLQARPSCLRKHLPQALRPHGHSLPCAAPGAAPDRILTLKVTLLLALTSLKRVGDLQALSVSEMCMDFAPGLVKVTLRPRPGYVPKVLSTSFRSQVVTLHSFHSPPFASGEDERLHMLCPVRALKMWTAPTIGGNPPSCWYVLVLAAVGLPHRSTEFLTGWGMLFRWHMRCVVFLCLSASRRILLGAWLPLKLFLEGSP